MRFRWGAALVAVPLLVSGCGSTKNVQTVKSPDYSDQPRNIVVIVQAPALDPRFNAAFIDSVGRCGGHASFAQAIPGQTVKVEQSDSLLTINELGHQTTTLTRYGYPAGTPWTSMIRLQVTLTDLKSKKPVWKAQADFNVGQFGTFHENDPTQRWGDDLAGLMLKDQLFQSCDFKRPSAPASSKTAP